MNYLLNATYQLFLLLVPLVTTPYISRILRADGIGMYSYSNSIIYYFTVFAALGTTMYGQREVAKNQFDRKKQTGIFWEISIIKLFIGILCVCVNLILCLGIYGKYSLLMTILTINIVAVFFDITFFFQGKEQYGRIVVRNVFVKSIGLISILLFVKSADDVWKYTIINSMMVFVSNLSLWFYLPKALIKVDFRSLNPWSHVKKILLLFVPTIAVSVYTMVDKTLIGLILQCDAENGFYEQSEKIIKMCVMLITCLSTVMISRNSSEYAEGKKDNLEKNIYFAARLVWLFSTPMVFGMASIAENMNLWFFGVGYTPVIKLIYAFCPLILVLGLNNVTGVQYLIATGKDRIFTMSVVSGAVINVILNLILIKTIGTIGAVIASVTAETCILGIQLMHIKSDINIKKFLSMGWKNVIASLLMFLVLRLLFNNLNSSALNTICIIGSGVLIYTITLIGLRDKFIVDVIKKMRK